MPFLAQNRWKVSAKCTFLSRNLHFQPMTAFTSKIRQFLDTIEEFEIKTRHVQLTTYEIFEEKCFSIFRHRHMPKTYTE